MSPRNQVAGGAHRRARPGAAAGARLGDADLAGRGLRAVPRPGLAGRIPVSVQLAGWAIAVYGKVSAAPGVNGAVCGPAAVTASRANADRDSTVWRWKEFHREDWGL